MLEHLPSDGVFHVSFMECGKKGVENPNSFGGHKFYNYNDHPHLQALPLREIPQWKTSLQQIMALLENLSWDGADTHNMCNTLAKAKQCALSRSERLI